MGGLCFFGSWDGGRRGENWYVVESTSAEGDALKLVLKGGCELLIYGFEGIEVWKESITIRAVERFVIRYGPGQEREIRPPAGWPPHSSDVAFEFAI
jgi:hypothetical protein